MHSLQSLLGNRDRKMQKGEEEICEGIHKINSAKDKMQRKWVRQRRNAEIRRNTELGKMQILERQHNVALHLVTEVNKHASL